MNILNSTEGKNIMFKLNIITKLRIPSSLSKEMHYLK